tara:strand:- start:780 stop:1028 length:249 start_codon:yes stop_codon:yes gene_type:complete
MKNETKSLNKMKVCKFNRNLTEMISDIEYQLYDLGVDYYSLTNTKYDNVYNRMKDLTKAMSALKKELHEMSELQNNNNNNNI